MKILLAISLFLLFFSCEELSHIQNKNGHTYLWQSSQFIHDPYCGECEKNKVKNDQMDLA